MSNQPRPDFSTPEHPPQFSGWFAMFALAPTARLRRIWAVDSRTVSPRCWRWLTA